MEANSKKTTIMNEVSTLEGELRSDRPPVDELNRDLRNYLGHPELQLEYEETGYRLKRNGQPANDLSAGEKSAFAFLYFLRRLSDTSFDLNNGIVIVDDPVSSLDANSLYYAFGFIKERTKDAGQLFIFTHSFPFFSLARNWFNYVKPKAKFYHTPTITDVGDLIFTDMVPAGATQGNASSGAASGFEEGFIFPPNIQLLLRVKNVSGAAAIMHETITGHEDA